MSQHPSDRPRDDELPGEAELSRLYAGASEEAPGPALDRRILAAARAAPATRARALQRWAVPLSLAAVVLLCAGVVLQVLQDDLLEPERAPLSNVHLPASAPVPAGHPQPEPKAEARAREAPQHPATSAPAPTAADAAPRAGALDPAQERRDAAAETQVTSEAYAPLQKSFSTSAAAQREEAQKASRNADVLSVQVTGQPGAYEFAVGVRSPDRGCGQYADWWEVVSTDGKLLYRRVLQHSHVDEQPFVRAGGPVPIQPDTVVWVRAHMNTSGYGGIAFRGSVNAGFAAAPLPADFAAALNRQPPLPAACAP